MYDDKGEKYSPPSTISQGMPPEAENKSLSSNDNELDSTFVNPIHALLSSRPSAEVLASQYYTRPESFMKISVQNAREDGSGGADPHIIYEITIRVICIIDKVLFLSMGKGDSIIRPIILFIVVHNPQFGGDIVNLLDYEKF